MAYTKTEWVNDSVPAINATNLNKIEQGIYDNAFESGSNANGNYIKFNDGTLIQWGKTQKNITLNTKSSSAQWYYSDGYQINFPQQFINTNYYTNVNNDNAGLISLMVYSTTAKTTSSFEFNLSCNIEVTSRNYDFSWIAIGRWK